MGLPIDPKIAAMSYLHTTGASRQSAGKRFWINRFACGGARCPSVAQGAPESGSPRHGHGDDQVHWLAPEASGMIAPWRPARTQPSGDEDFRPNSEQHDA